MTMTWPNGNSSACMVTVELDDEFIWLSMDPTNSTRPKTLSMGTYGMLRGLERVVQALADAGVKATFFVPGKTAEKYPERIRELDALGHEIALHGYAHENFGLLDAAEQKQVLEKGTTVLSDIVGKRPAGFRLPEGNMTPDTLRLIAEAGFLYDSSMLDSDLPYRVELADGPSSLVEIPMRWDMQDFPYFAFNYHPPVPAGACRIANYRQVYSIWLDELAGYHAYGLCYVCKFDPQSIGTPGRIRLLEDLLAEMKKLPSWLATGAEIAGHYTAQPGQ